MLAQTIWVRSPLNARRYSQVSTAGTVGTGQYQGASYTGYGQSGLSDANEGYAHNFDKQCSARGPLTRMLTPWTDSQRQPVRLPFYVSLEEDGGRPRDRNWTAKRGKLWN